LNFIKIKSFSPVKDHDKMKIKITDYEKILINYICNERLAARTYNSQISTLNPISKGQKTSTDISPKRTYK
jgi:hypothetical protein